MKTGVAATQAFSHEALMAAADPRYNAPIPLVRNVSTTKEKHTIKLFLRNNPTDATAGVYEHTFFLFESGEAEDYCRLQQQFAILERGQPITTPEGKYSGYAKLLAGVAADHWQTICDSQVGGQTNETFDAAVKEFAKAYMDEYALIEQKQYMRKRVGCPKTMTVRQFWTRLCEMNNLSRYLRKHREEETIIPEDELKSIYVHAMPQWMRNLMDRANFRWYL